MKKTMRKLTLSRETLYSLAGASLKEVAGGRSSMCVGSSGCTVPCTTETYPTTDCDTNITACSVC